MKKIWHLIWKYFWHLNFLSKLRDKHCWRVSKWQINFDIQWQIHTFHICKWIFVAISKFSKIDEIISELTALILKDHISSLLSAIYFWSIWTIFETRQTVSNFLLRLIILIGWIEGFRLFRHRHFITGIFRHVDISSPWSFRQGDYLAHELFRTRTFWHRDITALIHFGTWIFRQNGCFGTVTHFSTGAKMSAQTSILLCMVPKFPSAETSMCWNIFVPKCPSAIMSPCQNVPVPVSSCRSVHGDRMSMCRNVQVTEKSPCQNVPVMKCPCQTVSCRNVRCRNKPKPNWTPQEFGKKKFLSWSFLSISILVSYQKRHSFFQLCAICFSLIWKKSIPSSLKG